MRRLVPSGRPASSSQLARSAVKPRRRARQVRASHSPETAPSVVSGGGGGGVGRGGGRAARQPGQGIPQSGNRPVRGQRRACGRAWLLRRQAQDAGEVAAWVL